MAIVNASVKCKRTFSDYSAIRFENGKSDKEILDNLVDPNRYDKRLLPPVDGKCIFIQTTITRRIEIFSL